MVTLTAHEQQEFARAAQAMYRRGANGLGHLLSTVAAQRVADVGQYDRAAQAYRDWLVFDEPRDNSTSWRCERCNHRKDSHTAADGCYIIGCGCTSSPASGHFSA